MFWEILTETVEEMWKKERGQLESKLTFLLKAAYLSIKWLAMQRWNVLFSRWIKSLRQFPTWQLPQIPLTSFTVSLFLSFPSLPSLLFFWKLLATEMTEIRVSFQKARGVERHRHRKDELYRSKCFNLFKNSHYHVTWTRPFCLRLRVPAFS